MVFKKDLNVGLIILIIITVVVLSGFVVYAQTQITELSSLNVEKEQELAQIKVQMEENQEKQAQLEGYEQRFEQSKQALEQEFMELKGEYEEALEENQELLENQEKKVDYSTIAHSYRIVSQKNVDLKAEMQQVRDAIYDLKDEKKQLCSSLESAGIIHDLCLA